MNRYCYLPGQSVWPMSLKNFEHLDPAMVGVRSIPIFVVAGLRLHGSGVDERIVRYLLSPFMVELFERNYARE